MPKVMRLIMYHGRLDPEQSMDDWGSDGPTLSNVVAVHFTYGTPNVFFASVRDAQEAARLTGWAHFESAALTMTLHDDLVKVTGRNGRAVYYGDWEVQTQTGGGVPVPDPPDLWRSRAEDFPIPPTEVKEP